MVYKTWNLLFHAVFRPQFKWNKQQCKNDIFASDFANSIGGWFHGKLIVISNWIVCNISLFVIGWNGDIILWLKIPQNYADLTPLVCLFLQFFFLAFIIIQFIKFNFAFKIVISHTDVWNKHSRNRKPTPRNQSKVSSTYQMLLMNYSFIKYMMIWLRRSLSASIKPRIRLYTINNFAIL